MGKRSKRYKKKLENREREGNPSPKRNPLIHPIRTSPKGYQYFFHPKHHVPRQGDHSCWLPTISRDVEFSIFESAVRLDLGDEDGNLYNVERDEEDSLMTLGHESEQIAFFWKPRSEMEWHGYPLWPLITRQSNPRVKQMNRPSDSVFEMLVQTGRLTIKESLRLKKGRDA